MKARAATPTESANVHQGIWQDEGKTYLDVSDRVGGRASRSSLETALSRGISQKQLGVYAAGAGKTLPIHSQDQSTGIKTVNPAVEMTLGYLQKQREESAQRRKIKPEDKAKALEALKQAK
jgi:hypothetical protein